jgi:hypothetical protein
MHRKGNGGALSIAVKAVTLLLVVFFIYIGETAYTIFALPVFLLDWFLSEHYRNAAVVSIFKLFLVFQGLGLWYLNTQHFFDAPANEIQKSLIFHEQFDWQNATTALLDLSQRTITSLSAAQIAIVSPRSLQASTTFPVKIVPGVRGARNEHSLALLNATFGALPDTDFPDLLYYSKHEIQSKFPRIFRELPSDGFDSRFKNPCWQRPEEEGVEGAGALACLPYAYVLGQPKSGTSDLFERLKGHGDVM